MYFEINPRVINRQIKHLRSLGYDSIRIPGGKSKGKTKYSGIFAFVVDPNTKRKYLICTPYNSSFHLKEKEKDSLINIYDYVGEESMWDILNRWKHSEPTSDLVPTQKLSDLEGTNPDLKKPLVSE